MRRARPAATRAGHGGAGAVDVVGAPAAEPRAVRLLRGEQPGDAAVGAAPRRRRRAASISTTWAVTSALRRVDDLAEVAERQRRGQRAGVVGVERAPAAVAATACPTVQRHAAVDGGVAPGPARDARDPAQREHDLGGVVDVGVVVVVELERPAARGQPGPAHRPVAADPDLLAEQPVGAAPHERGSVGRHARRRPARSAPARCPTPATGRPRAGGRAVRALTTVNAVEPGEAGPHHRVVERVAEQVQRDQRVHPRRLDAAPAAVGLLAVDDPRARPVRTRVRAAAGGRVPALVAVQRPVEALEASPARSRSAGGAAGAGAGRSSSSRTAPGAPADAR